MANNQFWSMLPDALSSHTHQHTRSAQEKETVKSKKFLVLPIDPRALYTNMHWAWVAGCPKVIIRVCVCVCVAPVEGKSFFFTSTALLPSLDEKRRMMLIISWSLATTTNFSPKMSCCVCVVVAVVWALRFLSLRVRTLCSSSLCTQETISTQGARRPIKLISPCFSPFSPTVLSLLCFFFVAVRSQACKYWITWPRRKRSRFTSARR